MGPGNGKISAGLLFATGIVAIFALLPGLSMNLLEPGNHPVSPTWSKSRDGLRIGLAVENHQPDRLILRLCFDNVSDTELLVYFLDNAFFRSFQSRFAALVDNGDIIPLTSPSPGHGYIVGIRDFHRIRPATSRCFEETVTIPANPEASITGLTWTYQNDIPRWRGGITTFDGQTEQVFDESEDADLWVGDLEVEVAFDR